MQMCLFVHGQPAGGFCQSGHIDSFMNRTVAQWPGHYALNVAACKHDAHLKLAMGVRFTHVLLSTVDCGRAGLELLTRGDMQKHAMQGVLNLSLKIEQGTATVFSCYPAKHGQSLHKKTCERCERCMETHCKY